MLIKKGLVLGRSRQSRANEVNALKRQFGAPFLGWCQGGQGQGVMRKHMSLDPAAEILNSSMAMGACLGGTVMTCPAPWPF